jgi:hypothetical protein
MLTAFAAAFTIVFAFVWAWVYNFTTETTLSALATEVELISEKTAEALDPAQLAEFSQAVRATPAADRRAGDISTSRTHVQELTTQYDQIITSVPTAVLSSYYLDPSDQRLYYGASQGLEANSDYGTDVGMPIDQYVEPATVTAMAEGLTRTTSQPPYSDDYGSWISAFTRSRKRTAPSSVASNWTTRSPMSTQSKPNCDRG